MALRIELLHLLAEATSGIAQHTCGIFNLFPVDQNTQLVVNVRVRRCLSNIFKKYKIMESVIISLVM
ncbi:hypothetical protein Pint_30764 [Pistacia integerrima]|uniref:Uncharacterized protein n=1 Tax=Pistacia integerrima TaxID=434235 RepID=A0ACC0X0Y3_9ROSI|nr:hypothetical protein Pint_30764 [Pistacia integerrima]